MNIRQLLKKTQEYESFVHVVQQVLCMENAPMQKLVDQIEKIRYQSSKQLSVIDKQRCEIVDLRKQIHDLEHPTSPPRVITRSRSVFDSQLKNLENSETNERVKSPHNRSPSVSQKFQVGEQANPLLKTLQQELQKTRNELQNVKLRNELLSNQKARQEEDGRQLVQEQEQEAVRALQKELFALKQDVDDQKNVQLQLSYNHKVTTNPLKKKAKKQADIDKDELILKQQQHIIKLMEESNAIQEQMKK